MKALLGIISFIIITVSSFSQNSFYERDLLVETDSCKKLFDDNLKIKEIKFKSTDLSRIDSIVSYNYFLPNDSVRYYKEEYSEYEGNDYKLFVSSFWDTTNLLWKPDFRIEYQYMSPGLWSSRNRYDWDTNSGNWIARDIYTREYSEDGKVIGSLLILWSRDEEKWINSWKSDFTYSDDFSEGVQITSNWSLDLNLWIPDYKYEYQYNSEEILISYISYKWSVDSNDWIRNTKRTSVIDENNNTTQLYYWNWIESDNDWVYSSRYIREFDNLGNIVLSIRDLWDTDIEEWVYSNKEVKSFDSNNNITLNEYYNSDSQSLPTSRRVYEYDDEGDILNQYYYLRNLQSQEMENRHRDLYTYNDDKSIAVRRSSYWDEETEQWVLYMSESWYYNNLSGLKEIDKATISVFPNPASEIVNITGLHQAVNIEIFNLRGQHIKSFYQVESLIDVADIKPGLYIFEFKSEGESIVKRIVIE